MKGRKITVNRVNFQHPETGKFQNGFGVKQNNNWIIRTYYNEVLNIQSIQQKFTGHGSQFEKKKSCIYKVLL